MSATQERHADDTRQVTQPMELSRSGRGLVRQGNKEVSQKLQLISLAATQAILDATMLLVPMLQSPVEMLKDRVGVESADARLLREKFSVTMEHASGLVRSFVERWEAGEPRAEFVFAASALEDTCSAVELYSAVLFFRRFHRIPAPRTHAVL